MAVWLRYNRRYARKAGTWQQTKDATKCAVEHHILGRSNYVSEEPPICGCRAHHGGPGLPSRRGSLVGDPGRQCERRSYFRSKVALQALESGLGGDQEGQERSECACPSCATNHPARHIPCQRSAASIFDSFVSGRKAVSGQLPRKGVHVGAAFSGSEQLREIAGENRSR